MAHAPVTVVLPAYNSAATLSQAIDTVLAQTLPPAQVIVVDDGSTDNTAELLEQYAGRVEVLRQSNQGVSLARNAGIALATQPLVALQDADDVWHPRKLELQMQVLERHPEIALLGTGVFSWPAESLPPIEACIDDALKLISREQLIVRNRLGTATTVFRRDVLEKSGLFDPDMVGVEDRDLWIRIAAIASVARLNLPLAGRREVPGSMSKIAELCEPAAWRLFHRLEDCGAFTGRPILWCKTKSHLNNTFACVWSEAGHNGRALLRSTRALLWYPMPYARCDVDTRLERLKRLGANVFRVLRSKHSGAASASERESTTAPPAAAANTGTNIHG